MKENRIVWDHSFWRGVPEGCMVVHRNTEHCTHKHTAGRTGKKAEPRRKGPQANFWGQCPGLCVCSAVPGGAGIASPKTTRLLGGPSRVVFQTPGK